jgi:hypothetical protein
MTKAHMVRLCGSCNLKHYPDETTCDEAQAMMKNFSDCQ